MDLTELRRTIISCKESISSATQNLTKLTGRNFDKSLDSDRQFNNVSLVSRDNFTNTQRLITKRRINFENETTVDMKRSKVEREIPSLNSTVQMTRGRTRDDALHDLKVKENPKDKERCKRLFGHLMGTLNSIKKESEMSTNDPQQITRMKIEKKVEEDHKIISETIQREQNELIRAKKDRQNELKALNQRYRAAEAFERWRTEKEKMKGFIRTSKPPYIFYKPRIINEEVQLRIDETAREIELMIETRKKKLELEIDKVIKQHQEMSSGKESDIKLEMENSVLDESFIGSTVSVVSNNRNVKDRCVSPANSFDSEDYDDMIEEIEITMHDEPVQVHEEMEVAVTDIGDNIDIDTSDRTIEFVAQKDQLVIMADQPVDIVDQPVDIVDQKVDIVDEKVENSDQSVNLANQATKLVNVDQSMIDMENINTDEENTTVVNNECPERIIAEVNEEKNEKSDVTESA